jgi:hypothetical protein
VAKIQANTFLKNAVEQVHVEPQASGSLSGTGKIAPVLLTEDNAPKAYWESGGIAPLIL